MWRPRPVATESNVTLATVKLHLLCARRQTVGAFDKNRCGLHTAINELLSLWPPYTSVEPNDHHTSVAAKVWLWQDVAVIQRGFSRVSLNT